MPRWGLAVMGSSSPRCPSSAPFSPPRLLLKLVVANHFRVPTRPSAISPPRLVKHANFHPRTFVPHHHHRRCCRRRVSKTSLVSLPNEPLNRPDLPNAPTRFSWTWKFVCRVSGAGK